MGPYSPRHSECSVTAAKSSGRDRRVSSALSAMSGRARPWRNGRPHQSATADAPEIRSFSNAVPGAGAILSAGALLQVVAMVARLKSAVGEPDATEHRMDGGSSAAGLVDAAGGTAGCGGGVAGDAGGPGGDRPGGRRAR